MTPATGTGSAGSAAAGSSAAGTGPAASTGTAVGGNGSAQRATSTVRPTGQVEVGFFVVKDLGPATRALGVSGLSTGSGANQVNASVALLNRGGGLNGRIVKPVIIEQDATQNAQAQMQAGCSSFFDDHKVVAVVAWGLLPVLESCSNAHHVPYVTSGNRTTSSAEIGRYPYLAIPSQYDLRRVVATLIPSLSSQGYFRPRAATETMKVGLLYNGDPDFSSVPSLVKSELARLGVALTDQQSMPGVDDTSQVTAASNAGSSAVLRFRGEGITHVVAVDKSGQAIAYFALAAQNQQYYPQFGLSSLELPASLRTVLSAQQLQGARGVGWLPSFDVPAAGQPALSSNAKACVDAMSRAGEDMTLAATRGAALATCDSTLLMGAAYRAQPLTADGFVSGLRAVAAGYPPAVTFADDFRSHRDGAAQVRPLAYQGGCDCFAYIGPAVPTAT
ncbi:MAG: hypothetical protein M3N21_04645 [Actinomycetota bacterium]|nr:hypothetical protein [Actinomycetota bacterium]